MENVFEKMAAAGWSIVREYCVSNKLTAAKLADVTGCDAAKLEQFLENSSVPLTGKEWERLIYACTTHPEMWVYRALEVPIQATGAIVPLAGGSETPPTAEDDAKIRSLLEYITWFYQTASWRAVCA